MTRLLNELRRRSVFRVAAAYLVIAWVLIQLAALLENSLGLPLWFDAAIISFLVIGFPIALILAWAFELTPEGVQKTSSGDPNSGTRPLVPADYLMFGVLVIVLGATGYQIATRGGSHAGLAPGAMPVVETDTDESSFSSIAVLPFVNMSGSTDQEYFSDGITEEIINALVRIPHLPVAARTSVFAFKNSTDDIQTIGSALGVTHVLEGSVRSTDGQFRITAQLINVTTGFHLWSETYDRPDENIFVVQETIANEIAARLTSDLSSANPVPNRTASIDAYDHYLRGAAALRERHLSTAQSDLEQALEADPDFAPAWATLAIVHEIFNNFEEAEAAANRALALDENNVDALTALASIHRDQLNWLEADRIYRQAYAIDPDSSELAEDYAEFLLFAGYADRARTIARRGHELDPFMMPLLRSYVEALITTGDYDTALEIIGYRGHQDLVLAMRLFFARYMQDGVEGMIDVLTLFRQLTADRLEAADNEQQQALLQFTLSKLEEALAAVGPDADAEAIAAIRADIVDGQPNFPINISAALGMELGMDDEILDALTPPENEAFPSAFIWQPPFARLRSDPKFNRIVERMQLPPYWRVAGWPDFCRPLDGDEFECFDPDAA
ncbi:tetratricopeptide repeat protein [Hyphobacterium sp.]|uniref:tetratricopeptide repeat protein n=1 Tax=Hyphobacterium sp. TaxID=2004662 RepID=UPI003B525EF5